jgi:hypothetical protein
MMSPFALKLHQKENKTFKKRSLFPKVIMSTFKHHLPLLRKYSLTPKNTPKWGKILLAKI